MTNRKSIRLALIGSGGMLAAKVKDYAPSCYDIFHLDLPEFDLADRDQVIRTLEDIRPRVVVNCAAYTDVDGCESEEQLATLVNGQGPANLAEAAINVGATLVHISTDYVFDGRKTSPYSEEDLPHPQSAYGRSKLAGERAILESGLQKCFIVRTSWLYGPGGKNFVETIARLAAEREELRIVADQVGTPTYTGDLADAIFSLLDIEAYGLYHFSDSGSCSWYEFAEEVVAQLTKRGELVKVERVLPIRTEAYPLPAERPAYSVFSKDKYLRVTGAAVPDWRESLGRYFDERSC